MDRFHIRGELGSGGFGTVYRAYDEEDAQLVALKLLQLRDPHALRRFKAEFRTLARIAHEHLAAVYELHQDVDRWFFTMEYVDGVPFDRYLLGSDRARGGEPLRPTVPDRPGARRVAADRPPLDPVVMAPPLGAFRRVDPGSLPTPTPLVVCEPFPGIAIPDAATFAAWDATRPRAGFGPPPLVDFAELRRLFRQLVEGLAWLHQAGALHRDIKPSNVLVTRDGHVKIVDFGLVSHRFRADPGDPEPGAGTPSYMAPELCAGRAPSPASDWYAVGVMLYLALTDRLPFEGDSACVVLAKQALDPRRPSQVVSDVPADLDAICLALLARNPIDRPGVAELLAVFGPDELRPSEPVPADRVFVGRAPEVRALVEALAPVAAGKVSGPRVALVQGPTGLGKSALVEHVLSAFPPGSGAVILRSHGFERGNLRYRALDGAVDDLSRLLLELGAQELERVLPANRAERAALAATFPVLRLGASGAYPPSEAPDAQVALGALRETLGRLAALRTVIVFVDDLEWVDPASIDALAELLRPDAPPLGWIFTYAADDAAGGSTLADFTQRVLPLVAPDDVVTVTLQPLSEAECERLAAELAIGATPDEVRIIAAAARGDPALVGELATSVRSAIGHRRRPLQLIDDLVVTQLEHLGGVSREVMELVSVASGPVSTQLVRAITGAGPRELGLLLQHHLLRRLPGPAGERVQPWHDEVREAARRACSD
ncbi:MAG: serine/threonine-protein kinase [Myxococcota bacterium]